MISAGWSPREAAADPGSRSNCSSFWGHRYSKTSSVFNVLVAVLGSWKHGVGQSWINNGCQTSLTKSIKYPTKMHQNAKTLSPSLRVSNVTCFSTSQSSVKALRPTSDYLNRIVFLIRSDSLETPADVYVLMLIRRMWYCSSMYFCGIPPCTRSGYFVATGDLPWREHLSLRSTSFTSFLSSLVVLLPFWFYVTDCRCCLQLKLLWRRDHSYLQVIPRACSIL